MSATWFKSSDTKPLPKTAVVAGSDSDGDRIYVGRASHNNNMIPAKVIPNKGVAFICDNGKEYPKSTYEVLCHEEWQRALAWKHYNGEIQRGAIIAGQTANGEHLYVGRVLHNGSLTVGKVQYSRRCLCIPYGGKELKFTKDFEVLVNTR